MNFPEPLDHICRIRAECPPYSACLRARRFPRGWGLKRPPLGHPLHFHSHPHGLPLYSASICFREGGMEEACPLTAQVLIAVLAPRYLGGFALDPPDGEPTIGDELGEDGKLAI